MILYNFYILNKNNDKIFAKDCIPFKNYTTFIDYCKMLKDYILHNTSENIKTCVDIPISKKEITEFLLYKTPLCFEYYFLTGNGNDKVRLLVLALFCKGLLPIKNMYNSWPEEIKTYFPIYMTNFNDIFMSVQQLYMRLLYDIIDGNIKLL